MVVQNDYSTGLMNGDVGICLPRAETAAGEPQLRVVFVSADAKMPVRWLLPSRLPQVETVYAMTVHKSQGSEFGHVVLVLPEQGSSLLNRELIYTGITRAARQFSLLCADGNVLQQAVQQRTERSGGLRLSSL
jgi:exodeoxyribonuclease V alpha subunit